MAEADPLVDEYLDENDRRTMEAIEGPGLQSGDGPAPSDLDEIAPPAPVAPPIPAAPEVAQALAEPGPGEPGSKYEGPAELAPGAPEPLPGAPEPMALPGMDVPIKPGSAEDIANRQGVLDVEKAKAAASVSVAQAAAAKEADEDARLERADYLQRRKVAEDDLAAKTKRYEETKLVDPRSKNRFKSTLAVIFGGLGAAYRSAGGGDSKNYVLANLMKQWEDDTELQKANISALRDQAIQARTRLSDVDEGRRAMSRDADARLLAKYNLALKQGEAQLKNQGANQAQIDADRRILQLREAKKLAEAKARQAEDAHALNQARIAKLNADAARLGKKGKGGGGGGGGGAGSTFEREQAVAKHLIANPGDIPGAMQIAGPGFDPKRFDKIVANTKGTEGQNKNAQQAKIGSRALDEIEASGYKPSKDDIQKWLNNSRLVHLADKEGVVGGLTSLGQTFGAVPQSEVEGLSPDAAAYFGNVRRYMETIGRAQSGAAISPSEWTNFFNQYGPNSKGGIQAAREYMADQLKLSGVAGRSLSSGGGEAGPEKPAKGGGFTVGQVLRPKTGPAAGKTIRITSTDGAYDVVSEGRKPADIKL